MHTPEIGVYIQNTQSGKRLGEKRMECNTQNIRVKLVGESNMFSECESHIGGDNVPIVKEKLKKEGIKLIGEVVGDTFGRSLLFFTDLPFRG